MNHKPDNNLSRQTVGTWLKKSFQWQIPVYQRHYAWETGEAGPVQIFWETIIEQTIPRIEGEHPIPPHYFGAILVDKKINKSSISGITEFDVVDGQQRLTTLSIALLAIIRTERERKLGKTIKEELHDHLFLDKNTIENSKLKPTNFDQPQYDNVLLDVYRIIPNDETSDILANKEKAKESKITKTFQFFYKNMEAFLEGNGNYSPDKCLQCLKETILNGFELVLIPLKEKDEAQKVFESLNNTAKPLTTFDLIRNNVFYRAAKEQEGRDIQLFRSEDWQKLEQPFWEKLSTQRQNVAGNTHIESYIARMLVAKSVHANEIKFNRNDIFKSYKEFSAKYSNVEEEIKSVVDYTDIYMHLAISASEPSPIYSHDVCQDISFGIFLREIWENKDFYPVIFMIMKSNLTQNEKQEMIHLLESYVIRRAVCGLSSEGYNKITPTLCREFHNNIVNYEILHAELTRRKANSDCFPDDQRVEQDCVGVNFYKSKIKEYILKEIEIEKNSSNDETAIVKGLTVDHILPKKWSSNSSWQNDLFGKNYGSNIPERHRIQADNIDSVINTIGNLTLMSRGRNASKSNNSFNKVKDLLRSSNLKINRELAEKTEWNEKEIRSRSRKLATIICKRWPLNNRE